MGKFRKLGLLRGLWHSLASIGLVRTPLLGTRRTNSEGRSLFYTCQTISTEAAGPVALNLPKGYTMRM